MKTMKYVLQNRSIKILINKKLMKVISLWSKRISEKTLTVIGKKLFRKVRYTEIPNKI